MIFHCVLIHFLILSSIQSASSLPKTSDYEIVKELEGVTYEIRCVEVKEICFLYNPTSIVVFDLLLPGITKDISIDSSNLQDLRTIVQPNGIFLIGQCQNGEILVYFMEDAHIKEAGQYFFWKRFPLVNTVLSQMQNVNVTIYLLSVIYFSRRRIRNRFHRIYQYFLLENEIHNGESVFFYSMNTMSLDGIKGFLQEGDFPQLVVKRMVFRKQQKQLQQRNGSDENDFYQDNNINTNNILKITVSQNQEIAAVVDSQFRVAFMCLDAEFEMPMSNDIEVELIDYHNKYNISQETEYQGDINLVQIYFNDFRFELVLVYNYFHKPTGRKLLIIDILEYSIKDNTNSIISFNRHTWNSKLIRLDVDGGCAAFFLDSQEILYHDFMKGNFFKKSSVQLSFSEDKVIKTFHSRNNQSNVGEFLTLNRKEQILRLYIKKCPKDQEFSYITINCSSAGDEQEIAPRNLRFVDKFTIKFEKKYIPQSPHDNNKDKNEYFIYWAVAIILVLCILYLHRNSHRIRINGININGENRRFFEQQTEESEVKQQRSGRFPMESQYQQAQFSEGILSGSSNQFEMQLLNFEQSHRKNQNVSPSRDNLIQNIQFSPLNERESIHIREINFPFPKISKIEEKSKKTRSREDNSLLSSNLKKTQNFLSTQFTGKDTIQQKVKKIKGNNLNDNHQFRQTTKPSAYKKLKNKMLHKINQKYQGTNFEEDICVNTIKVVQLKNFSNVQSLDSNEEDVEEEILWQRRENQQEINLKISTTNNNNNNAQEFNFHPKSAETSNNLNFLQFLNSQQLINVEKQIQNESLQHRKEHSENITNNATKNDQAISEQFNFSDIEKCQMNDNYIPKADLNKNSQRFFELNHNDTNNLCFIYQEEEEKQDFHTESPNPHSKQEAIIYDEKMEEKQMELFEEKLKEQMDEFRYKGAAINQANIDLFSCFSQTAQQSSINIQPNLSKKIKLNGSDSSNLSNHFEIPNFYKLIEDMSPESLELYPRK